MTTPEIDKYSGSRLEMAARYYYPSFKLPLMLYPIISTVLAVVSMALSQTILGTLVSGFLSLILSIMLYFFPLFIYKTSAPVTDTLLPVTPGEKLTIFAVACLIINPILVYAPYYLIQWLVEPLMPMSSFQMELRELSDDFMRSTYGAGMLQSLVPLVTCMFVVVTSPRRRVGMAVAMTVVSLMVLMFAAGIYGFAMAFSSEFQEVVEASENASYNAGYAAGAVAGQMKSLVYVIATVSLVYTLFMTWLAYRKIKHMQM